MLAGMHFLEDSYTGVDFAAASALDTGGAVVGARSPERMLRLYYKGNPDPALLAAGARLWASRGWRVVPGNEPNLQSEGYTGPIRDYAGLVAEVKREAPGARIYFPGLSPGGLGWERWLDPVDPTTVDGFVVHAYGTLAQMQAVVQTYLDRFPGKPLWVGEVNFGAGQSADRAVWARDHLKPFLDWCARVGTEAVTYFSYRWPHPDQPTPTPVDAAGTPIETTIRDWTPPQEPSVPSLDMVDLSNNNGADVDLAALKAAGVVLVGLKASQGKDFADETFPDYWQRAGELELGRLAYCFMNPDDPSLGSTGNEDETSALFARQIEKMGGLKAGDLIALDCEAGSGNLLGFVLRTLELMEERCGVMPGAYSARWWTRAHGVESSEMARYWKWWAAYGSTLGTLPVGWERPLLWQTTGAGTVPGLSGVFDLSTLLVPLPDLLARGYREGDDVITLNDADKAALLAAAERGWKAAESIAAILAKYGAEGQSAAEWCQEGIKAPIVLSKILTGTNTPNT